jgi:hypothetical protein
MVQHKRKSRTARPSKPPHPESPPPSTPIDSQAEREARFQQAVAFAREADRLGDRLDLLAAATPETDKDGALEREASEQFIALSSTLWGIVRYYSTVADVGAVDAEEVHLG